MYCEVVYQLFGIWIIDRYAAYADNARVNMDEYKPKPEVKELHSN